MTEIAAALETVDRAATAELDRAFATHYADLKRIAHARLSRSGVQGGLQTTALVHDCYIKLASGQARGFENRLQFLAYASRTVRSIVLDLIREERALRRGGAHEIVTFDPSLDIAMPASLDIETVNNALEALARIDPPLARLVELRFFGGMTETELAELLGLSVRTVQREWQKARALLLTLVET